MTLYTAGTLLFLTHTTVLFNPGSKMVMPTGLALTFGILVLGFLFALVRTIYIKSGESKYKYRRLDYTPGASNEVMHMESSTNPRSYQNSAPDNYAIPQNQQKVLTYCVVDGRLMDS